MVQESDPVTQADEKVEQEPEQKNAQEQDAEEADPSADMAFTDDDK